MPLNTSTENKQAQGDFFGTFPSLRSIDTKQNCNISEEYQNRDRSNASQYNYRTVFISDTHLGTEQTQVDLLYNFLQTIQCQKLYLVGDIVDGYRLQKKWYWPQSHSQVLQAILQKAEQGTEVIYIPGNHDEFVRLFLSNIINIGRIKVMEEDYHTTVDKRKFLVLHGDRCDTTVHLKTPWSKALGGYIYNFIILLNLTIKSFRKYYDLSYWSLVHYIKDNAKVAKTIVSNYEKTLAMEAKKQQVHGVICGHIHNPKIAQIDDVIYMNDGDWVDSCSAIVEDFQGNLKLLNWVEHYNMQVQSWKKQQAQKVDYDQNQHVHENGIHQKQL